MSTSLWHSYRLRIAKPGVDTPIVGALGGHPRGVGATDWPLCRVCRNPMCFMGQLDAGPWLSLAGNARVSAFICHATGGRCEDWDANKGANALLLHPTRDDNLYDGPPTVRVYPKKWLTVEPAFDEEAFLEACKRQRKSAREMVDALRYDKIGGCAAWLTGDESPMASTGGSMRLIAQLTTEIVAFDITDRGVAYLFIDPQDRDARRGRLLWQAV